jgi:lipopolysaccharide transport system ATP-binding protein
VSPPAIRVERLGKRFVINELRYRRTLSERIGSILAAPLGLAGRRNQILPDEIWAIRDVSFEVGQGKVLGVIGRNGSGKSTLLKILGQITTPTEGRAELFGRVGVLLEVGTGFHPDLSGRENIVLSGTIIGMHPSAIRRHEEEIVEFAEVAEFIDTPVKHYSSGMFLRLAFSVAAHLDAEIMLIDEVFAVGDGAFQEKCKKKISSIALSGRTVLFTSHDMEAVRSVCHHCLVLDHGRVVYFGDTEESIQKYLALTAPPAAP